MSKILALDYGKKRTGIAVTDDLQIIASGLTTVDTENLLEFLKSFLSKENVSIIVVGKPKRLDYTDSESEALIKPFLKNFESLFPNVKIERVDERFTSKIAQRTMLQSGLKKKQRQNKALVDEISATLILQSYLYYK